jgi:DNA-binding transcriptional regulator YhcF (GntR family)
MKKIPFKIDRNSRENLPEQLANGFREAILGGYYKPGERLPSFAQMAAELGVSIRTPRDAMKLLVDANLVRSRPRIGCEVLARDERIWKGLVAVAVNSAYEGSYYISVLIGAIRKAMLAAGYAFRSVTVDVGPRGKPDFSHLDAVLAGPLSFVIAIYPDDRLATRILKSGKPALACVDVQSGGGLEIVRFSSVRNLLSIARTIQKAGVRSIVVAEYARMPLLDRLCEKMGIALEYLTIRPREGENYLGSLKKRAMDAVIKRFSKGTALPDLLLFTDDYVAFGGLVGLAKCAVRVPEDLRVITLANVGCEPVFPVPLAQIRIDPRADGAALAAKALARIENRPFNQNLPLPEFVPGRSF